MLTIFLSVGMKERIAFRVVVFPEAVPPTIKMFCPTSSACQIYAAMSALIVPSLIRSIGVNGSFLNLLMVNVDPFFVTSLPSVAWILEPSGSEQSTMGTAMEMCFPERCTINLTKSSKSCSVSKIMLVAMEPNFL